MAFRQECVPFLIEYAPFLMEYVSFHHERKPFRHSRKMRIFAPDKNKYSPHAKTNYKPPKVVEM
ncbi:MAG: hypothetical protein LBV47_06280 [Bacteroidales bacterium]|nr:hypothetical protein [Bacteroidales bacterium]